MNRVPRPLPPLSHQYKQHHRRAQITTSCGLPASTSASVLCAWLCEWLMRLREEAVSYGSAAAHPYGAFHLGNRSPHVLCATSSRPNREKSHTANAMPTSGIATKARVIATLHRKDVALGTNPASVKQKPERRVTQPPAVCESIQNAKYALLSLAAHRMVIVDNIPCDALAEAASVGTETDESAQRHARASRCESVAAATSGR